jgi:hypothetical protein
MLLERCVKHAGAAILTPEPLDQVRRLACGGRILEAEVERTSTAVACASRSGSPPHAGLLGQHHFVLSDSIQSNQLGRASQNRAVRPHPRYSRIFHTVSVVMKYPPGPHLATPPSTSTAWRAPPP